MENTEIRKLVKVKVAAAILGVSVRKLQYMCKSGDIPHIKIGACVRFRPSDLEQFIESSLKSLKK